MPVPFTEADSRAMAEALGARLPAFREADAPDLFEGWAHRIALADSLRARGEPYADMVAEADRHIGFAPAKPDDDEKGVDTTDALGGPRLAAAPLSDWLGDIARLLGADLDPVPRPFKAAPAAPLT